MDVKICPSEDAKAKRDERKRKSEEKKKSVKAKRLQTREDQKTRGPLFCSGEIENPLILYDSPLNHEVEVVVDPRISDYLEKHQREGLEKMYKVLSSHIPSADNLCESYLLADGMGLGKTLQTIGVIWTLLTQSPEWDEKLNKVKPEINKVIIVAPKSVIPVWNDQFKKWLKPSGKNDATNKKAEVEMLDDRKSADMKREVTKEFMNPLNKTQILIMSYETFVCLTKDYQKGNKLNNPLEKGPLYENINKVVDLLVLDEAHYIKNKLSQRSEAIVEFEVAKKIALTGTPLQNNLKEYYTIINYLQPGLLPRAKDFRKLFEDEILHWVGNPNWKKGKDQLKELKRRISPFFLRRTKNPFVMADKTEYVVCCKMEEKGEEDDTDNIQLKLHNEFVKAYLSPPPENNCENDKDSEIQVGQRRKLHEVSPLQAITVLKDLCGHPKQVYEKCAEYEKKNVFNFSHLRKIFDEKNFINDDTEFEADLSAKTKVLENLLINIDSDKEKNDRVVIVSYYTHVLDMIELICKQRNFHFVRFDGSTSNFRRNKIIEKFNDPNAPDQFIMTMSSRAGGCGISLIGANHLIMFDPDWNPANDEQAMSRIYREGQNKQCFIYRLVTTASIEEEIFHRQIVKKLLSGAVLTDGNDVGIYAGETNDPQIDSSLFRKIDSKDLETCFTHQSMKCKRCDVKLRKERKSLSKHEISVSSDDLELSRWHHHFNKDSLPAECEAIQDAWGSDDDNISFLFRKKTTGFKKVDSGGSNSNHRRVLRSHRSQEASASESE